MIPDGRPPNYDEFSRVFNALLKHEKALDIWFQSEGITDVTGEDVLRCIVNDWPEE